MGKAVRKIYRLKYHACNAKSLIYLGCKIIDIVNFLWTSDDSIKNGISQNLDGLAMFLEIPKYKRQQTSLTANPDEYLCNILELWYNKEGTNARFAVLYQAFKHVDLNAAVEKLEQRFGKHETSETLDLEPTSQETATGLMNVPAITKPCNQTCTKTEHQESLSEPCTQSNSIGSLQGNRCSSETELSLGGNKYKAEDNGCAEELPGKIRENSQSDQFNMQQQSPQECHSISRTDPTPVATVNRRNLSHVGIRIPCEEHPLTAQENDQVDQGLHDTVSRCQNQPITQPVNVISTTEGISVPANEPLQSQRSCSHICYMLILSLICIITVGLILYFSFKNNFHHESGTHITMIDINDSEHLTHEKADLSDNTMSKLKIQSFCKKNEHTLLVNILVMDDMDTYYAVKNPESIIYVCIEGYVKVKVLWSILRQTKSARYLILNNNLHHLCGYNDEDSRGFVGIQSLELPHLEVLIFEGLKDCSKIISFFDQIIQARYVKMQVKNSYLSETDIEALHNIIIMSNDSIRNLDFSVYQPQNILSFTKRAIFRNLEGIRVNSFMPSNSSSVFLKISKPICEALPKLKALSISPKYVVSSEGLKYILTCSKLKYLAANILFEQNTMFENGEYDLGSSIEVAKININFSICPAPEALYSLGFLKPSIKCILLTLGNNCLLLPCNKYESDCLLTNTFQKSGRACSKQT